MDDKNDQPVPEGPLVDALGQPLHTSNGDILEYDHAVAVHFSAGKVEIPFKNADGEVEYRAFESDYIDMALEEDDYGSDYTVVQVSMKQYVDGEIKCPFSDSANIYRISDNMFASYESDIPFIVTIIDDDEDGDDDGPSDVLVV